jgi:hypothetical protein
MRKTPKQIFESGNAFEKHDWLASARADEIFGYFAYVGKESHQWECAAFALKIRLSKDAEIQSKRMVYFTIGIFVLTGALVLLTVALVVLTLKLASHP